MLAAAELLNAVNDTLVVLRQGREETGVLLSRLEAGLASLMARVDREKAPLLLKRRGLLRSISEGVRTIVTVTERLSDLRAEAAAFRNDLLRLAEVVHRIAGRLDGIEHRFGEVDKRVELAVKLAVKEELDRRNSSET
jgi:phosphoglycerate-specific signal transduction histidine kinase